MRNKKGFSFDEEKDAENIILDGFPNGSIDYSQMYLIAKYLRHTFGYGEIRLERELIKFCLSQDKNFNPVVEAEAIKKWITSAMNYGLRKIQSVVVSNKEITFLKEIDSNKDRKLIFMALILSKALKQRSTHKTKKELKVSDNYYIRFSNFQDIIRLAKINNVSEDDFAYMLNKYKDYLTLYNPERELIRLEFVDKNPDNIFIIENMDKLLDYYELFFGKNVIVCSICGKDFVKKSNRQIHCSECSKKVRNNKQKELMRKRRNL